MRTMKVQEVRNLNKLIILCGIFILALCTANTLASKVFVLGPWVMTAGILSFPITFMVTDVVGEVWGKRIAQQLVLVGFIANILMVGLYQLGILLTPAVFWGGQEALKSILGSVPRIVGASLAAYAVSQTLDVWLFHKIKDSFKYGLWLRNNVGTIVSQAVDSAIFLLLAFVGTMAFSELVSMYVAYIIVKWIIALLDTPFVYLGVWWARR